MTLRERLWACKAKLQRRVYVEDKAFASTLAPGDAGGWSKDVADIGTTRSMHLMLAWPSDLSIDDRLELLGLPAGCSSTTGTCAGGPALAVAPVPSTTLLSGTIE